MIWLVLWFTVHGQRVMVQMPVASVEQCMAAMRAGFPNTPYACATEEQAAFSIVDGDCLILRRTADGTDYYVCSKE